VLYPTELRGLTLIAQTSTTIPSRLHKIPTPIPTSSPQLTIYQRPHSVRGAMLLRRTDEQAMSSMPEIRYDRAEASHAIGLSVSPWVRACSSRGGGYPESRSVWRARTAWSLP
jgi:hypothetical protein